jgi:dynein heavy chain 2
MQNALILMNAQTTPFIVDPSTQAADWLKTNLGKVTSKLEVVNQQDPRFNNTLELAVRFGKTIVIQEVDQIEPVIYPLIRRDLVRQGPR